VFSNYKRLDSNNESSLSYIEQDGCIDLMSVRGILYNPTKNVLVTQITSIVDSIKVKQVLLLSSYNL
jgi:hypothetical protein